MQVGLLSMIGGDGPDVVAATLSAVGLGAAAAARVAKRHDVDLDEALDVAGRAALSVLERFASIGAAPYTIPTDQPPARFVENYRRRSAARRRRALRFARMKHQRRRRPTGVTRP